MHLSSLIGGSQTRFLLTYTTEKNYAIFGQILVDVDDYASIKDIAPQIQQEFDALLPDAMPMCACLLLALPVAVKFSCRCMVRMLKNSEIWRVKRKTFCWLNPDPEQFVTNGAKKLK